MHFCYVFIVLKTVKTEKEKYCNTNDQFIRFTFFSVFTVVPKTYGVMTCQNDNWYINWSIHKSTNALNLISVIQFPDHAETAIDTSIDQFIDLRMHWTSFRSSGFRIVGSQASVFVYVCCVWSNIHTLILDRYRYVYICTYIHDIYIYIYTRIYSYTHHMFIYIHICIYIYIYVCAYIK